MRRIDRLLGRTSQRSAPVVIGNFNDWASFMTQFSFGGSGYAVDGTVDSLDSMIGNVHRKWGPVAGAVVARGSLMSQVVPVWQNDIRGQAAYGNLFGTRDLTLFEQPTGVTREHLFSQVEIHVAYAGNAYLYAPPAGGLELLQPDRVRMVFASTVDTSDPNVLAATSDLLGYRYYKNGLHAEPEGIAIEHVAHFAPEPSATNPFLGESWVTGIVREAIVANKANAHLESFFDNGATPRTIVTPSKELTAAQVGAFQEMFEQRNTGAENAYKTWWIGGGSDINVVGTNLNDLDMRHVTGGLETAVSVRSRVPASVLGTREGMAGSSLNAGNYSATRRLWADGWFSPYAGAFCSELATLIPNPTGARLTFDPDRVLFLQEDRRDAAEIVSLKAAALRQLVDAGFDPDSAVDAVRTENLAALEHSGLTSVQLLPPGTTEGDPT